MWRLFAYEQYGIAPDIVTMAKGLGGGLPIGGVLAAKSARMLWDREPTDPPSAETQ